MGNKKDAWHRPYDPLRHVSRRTGSYNSRTLGDFESRKKGGYADIVALHHTDRTRRGCVHAPDRIVSSPARVADYSATFACDREAFISLRWRKQLARRAAEKAKRAAHLAARESRRAARVAAELADAAAADSRRAARAAAVVADAEAAAKRHAARVALEVSALHVVPPHRPLFYDVFDNLQILRHDASEAEVNTASSVFVALCAARCPSQSMVQFQADVARIGVARLKSLATAGQAIAAAAEEEARMGGGAADAATAS